MIPACRPHLVALLILIEIMVGGLCPAQNFVFHEFGTDDGLPSSEIYSLVEDKQGRIFVATDGGLARFDGALFELILTDRGDAPSVYSLVVSSTNRVFCASFDGRVFEYREGRLVELIDVSQQVRDYPRISMDDNDRLFCYLLDSILVMDLATDSWTEVWGAEKQNLNPIAPTKIQTTLAEWSRGEDSIMGWDEQSKHFRSILALPSFGVWEKIVWQNEDYYVNSWKLADDTYFRNESGRLVPEPRLTALLGKSQYTCSNEVQGQLYVGTQQGLIVISENGRVAQRMLPDCYISALLPTREGMLLVGTTNRGLQLVRDQNIRKATVPGIPQPRFLKVLDGNLYIGGSGRSLVKISPHGIVSSIESYTEDTEDVFLVLGKLLTQGQGVVADEDEVVLQLNELKKLLFDPRGSRLFGHTHNALLEIAYHWEGEGRLETGGHSVLNELRTRCMLFDEERGELWVGNNRGVWVYSGTGEVDTIRSDLGFITANEFAQAGPNEVWIACRSGILVYRNHRLVTRLNFDQVSSDASFSHITVAGDKVYASGRGELYRIDRESHRLELRLRSGCELPGVSIQGITYFEDSVYVLSDEGLVRFAHSYANVNKFVPELHLAGLEQAGNVVPFPTDLDYGFEEFDLEFEVGTLKRPEETRLEYVLDGLGSQWRSLEPGERHLSIFGLPEGNYTLKVRAVTGLGATSKVWNQSFSVQPPFFRSGAFLGILLVGMALLLAGGFGLRNRYLRRRMEVQRQLNLSEIKAIKSQMNPHFIFNALNSIQDLILQNDVRNSSIYLGKFAHLVREILRLSDHEFITLEKEVELLSLYLDLEELRFVADFSYEILQDLQSDMEELVLPPMIIQPFVENAVKHGLLHQKGHKRLVIRFEEGAEELTCIIEDNGVGRKRSAEIYQRRPRQHQSFSSSATEARILLLNELLDVPIRLDIEDLEQGTRVRLRIPIVKPG